MNEVTDWGREAEVSTRGQSEEEAEGTQANPREPIHQIVERVVRARDE